MRFFTEMELNDKELSRGTALCHLILNVGLSKLSRYQKFDTPTDFQHYFNVFIKLT